MRIFVVATFVISLALAGCRKVGNRAEAESAPLTVFAAASLTDAFSEIGAAFQAANPEVIVTFNFAGSQTLRTQIEQGAAADVFASANTQEMDALVASAMVAPDAPKAFLTNNLVVVLPETNPAAIAGLADLATPGLKLVLAAQEVPVGSYARQSLDNMKGLFGVDFGARVMANVVSNEDNVKQVLAKVQLGEADAGIVYRSDAVAAPALMTIEIPKDLNVIATYPIAPLLESEHPEAAARFVEYVISSAGQAILLKWGFEPPGE